MSVRTRAAGGPKDETGVTRFGAFHEPVMSDQAVGLVLGGGVGLYLDGTVGGGGHAEALLERCSDCRLIAVDRDPEALDFAKERLARFGDRVRYVEGRLDRVLAGAAPDGGPGRSHADDVFRIEERFAGALLDLGVSSFQIDEEARGFTFARGAPLDMRMGGDASSGPTAAEVLNHSDEADLARIFRDLGEEPRARRLAREIVRRRATERFEISDQLVAALASAIGRRPSSRDKARIFQALRIQVNAELEALERALPLVRELLRPGGVLAVLAYHSLEDRIVKRAFREWSRSCVCPPAIPVCRCRGEPLGEQLTRGPLRPSEEETTRNPRSRSARLRAWRRAS